MDVLIYILFFLLGVFITMLSYKLRQTKGCISVYTDDEGNPIFMLEINRFEDIILKKKVLLDVKIKDSQK